MIGRLQVVAQELLHSIFEVQSPDFNIVLVPAWMDFGNLTGQRYRSMF
jgi:hypothetical protein